MPNPQKVESLEVNEAEDGQIVYDPGRHHVHHHNTSAAVIFDLCDGSRTVEEVAAALAEVYSLEAPPLLEAQSGVDELTARGLLKPHDGSAD
jgi:hypothetical protein